MAVEEYAALDFTLAAFDCGDIMAGLFGETAVDKLLVEAELKKNYQQTGGNEDYRHEGIEERDRNGGKHECDREIYPSEEIARILLELLNIGALTAALVFEHISHVFARLLLTL